MTNDPMDMVVGASAAAADAQTARDLYTQAMTGISRKSFVGRSVLNRDSDPSERIYGTIGMSVAHLWFGARIFRVHDVRVHREALDGAWESMDLNGEH